MNDVYYNDYNTENTFIKFANNLASFGEAKGSFAAKFGGLSFEQTVAQAYEEIIGRDKAIAAGVNPDQAIAFFTNSLPYYSQVANERVVTAGVSLDQAVKVVAIGSILNEAIKADIGIYADAIKGLGADIADDGLTGFYGADLFAMM